MKYTQFLRHVVSLLLLGFLVFLAVGSSNKDGGSSSSSVAINASVKFNGTQFVIKNKDSFEWNNVELKVNLKRMMGGYLLKSERMAAGETYTVGAMQFAKSDGEKFNPFTHKPLNFWISCDTIEGRGLYFAEWE